MAETAVDTIKANMDALVERVREDPAYYQAVLDEGLGLRDPDAPNPRSLLVAEPPLPGRCGAKTPEDAWTQLHCTQERHPVGTRHHSGSFGWM